ncbi:MAG: PAS domain S-box protein [Planctomycetes bacterium]|nr:PAS domain S-box protein [Planctomycetota bacterium]
MLQQTPQKETALPALIENSADPVFALDGLGRFTFANARMRSLVGTENVAGLPLSRFVTPQDHIVLDEALATVACGERGEIDRVNIQGARRASLSISYSPAPTGMFCIAHEITGVAEVESDLWLKGKALMSVSDAVIICDALLPNLPIRFVNPAFTELTGYAAAQVLGRDARLLEGPATDLSTVERMCEAFADGRRFQGEVMIHRGDGSSVRTKLTIAPVYREGNLTHFVISVCDISKVAA